MNNSNVEPVPKFECTCVEGAGLVELLNILSLIFRATKTTTFNFLLLEYRPRVALLIIAQSVVCLCYFFKEQWIIGKGDFMCLVT